MDREKALSKIDIDHSPFKKVTRNIIRHKKTGRVVIFDGTVEDIKKTFNEDYELVEAAIKE